MTPRQIMERPAWRGWTRETVLAALGKPDGLLPDYHNCPVFKTSRIVAMEGDPKRLELLRIEAESRCAADRQSREEKRKARLAAREQRKLAKLTAFAVPSDRTISLFSRIPMPIQPRLIEAVRSVWSMSDGSAMKRFYKDVERASDMGPLAAYLMRAQKSSNRAKSYRGTYVSYAYVDKGDSLEAVCNLLGRQSALKWGWGLDHGAYCEHVLYVDLPNGQVSFHAPERGHGPNYRGEWDGTHLSESRIMEFALACMVIHAFESGDRSTVDRVLSTALNISPRTVGPQQAGR